MFTTLPKLRDYAELPPSKRTEYNWIAIFSNAGSSENLCLKHQPSHELIPKNKKRRIER